MEVLWMGRFCVQLAEPKWVKSDRVWVEPAGLVHHHVSVLKIPIWNRQSNIVFICNQLQAPIELIADRKPLCKLIQLIDILFYSYFTSFAALLNSFPRKMIARDMICICIYILVVVKLAGMGKLMVSAIKIINSISAWTFCDITLGHQSRDGTIRLHGSNPGVRSAVVCICQPERQYWLIWG